MDSPHFWININVFVDEQIGWIKICKWIVHFPFSFLLLYNIIKTIRSNQSSCRYTYSDFLAFYLKPRRKSFLTKMGQILMKRGAHKLVSRLMEYQLHPAVALGAKISLESITPTNPPPGSSLLACVLAISHPNISLRSFHDSTVTQWHCITKLFLVLSFNHSSFATRKEKTRGKIFQ